MKFQFGLNKEDIRPKLKKVMLNLDEREHQTVLKIAKNKDITVSALVRHWEKQYANAYSDYT